MDIDQFVEKNFSPMARAVDCIRDEAPALFANVSFQDAARALYAMLYRREHLKRITGALAPRKEYLTREAEALASDQEDSEQESEEEK